MADLQPKLLTCKQAALLTGYSVAYWRKRIGLRNIDIVRLGKRTVRIPVAAVETLIANSTLPAREQYLDQ